MSEYIERRIAIDAPPECVWQTLVDFSRFAGWNPFIAAIDGSPRPGQRLRLSLNPRRRRIRRVHATVLAVLPERELRWLERVIMPGLMDGEHGFELQAKDSARTLFIQHETFSGLLVPLIWRNIEAALSADFDAMNVALKARAEDFSALPGTQ